MESSIDHNNRIYHSKVDSSGRIVLPADVRLRQHIQIGDQVVIIESSDGLQLKTQEQAIAEAQACFAAIAAPDVTLSDEIIRDRREEAKRE